MSWETLGKLILYAFIIGALAYMTVKIVQIFMGGYEDISTENMMDALAKRIETVKQEQLTGPEASILVTVPPRHAIIGFSEQDKVLHFGEDRAWVRFFGRGVMPTDLERPGICRGTCLCAYRLEQETKKTEYKLNLEPTTCKKIPGKSISGSFAAVTFQKELLGYDKLSTDLILDVPKNPDGTYAFAFGGQPTTDVLITIKGDAVVLSAAPDSEEDLLLRAQAGAGAIGTG